MSTAQKNPTVSIFASIDSLLEGRQWKGKTLNERIDAYFVDFSMMPLMMQENYLKNNSWVAQSDTILSTLSRAADSISDGDIADSMIRTYVDFNSARKTFLCCPSTLS